MWLTANWVNFHLLVADLVIQLGIALIPSVTCIPGWLGKQSLGVVVAQCDCMRCMKKQHSRHQMTGDPQIQWLK